MSGNKTLYTTTKCRSMTTKTEFVEMWDKSKNKFRFVVLKNRKGWIKVNEYDFESLGKIISVELYIVDTKSDRLVSMIDINEIDKVI